MIPDWVGQPDRYTCGAASAVWALRYLGHKERLSVERLSKELHVKDVPWWLVPITWFNGKRSVWGTFPTDLLAVMNDYGHPVVLPGFGNYMDKVFGRGGVCLTGYYWSNGREEESHWVASIRDKDEGLVVMDPWYGMFFGKDAENHRCFGDVYELTFGFVP